MKTVLFLFNNSMYAMQPWLDDGRFNVVTVDFEDTDHSGYHKDDRHERLHRLNVDLSKLYALGDVVRALRERELALPSLVVSFAPCTDLAVSGAAHFKSKRERDPEFQDKATKLALFATKFNCAYAVENPVSVLSTLWRKPDTCFHPCDYAGYCPDGEHPEFPEVFPEKDRYNKKTCLWTGGGFKIPDQKRLEPIGIESPGHIRLGGKSARTKYIRSLTPRGLAQAIYEANCDVL
jgi:hypothetical protein